MTPAALLVTCLIASPSAPAQPAKAAFDWPQWRGPNRDGKSAETGLFPNGFPAGGPKVKWENLEVGVGYGTVAVVGDRVYLTGGTDNTAGSPEYMLCLNAADGKEVWRTPFETSKGGFNTGWGGGPRSTPTVANGFVYAVGATGDVVCVSAADGKKVWGRNLVKEFGGGIPTWGYAESPLVDGDSVVVTPGKGTGMAKLNAKTGETIWECKELKDGAGYASIIPTTVGSVPVYVQQTMEHVVGVRATDGKLLFSVGDPGRRIAVIPTVVVADGYVFSTAGYGFGCESYKLEPDGDGVKAEKVFGKTKTLANHHGGVVQVGDYIYGHSDAGGWTCLKFKEPTTEAVWQSQKLGKGSVTFADGHLFCYEEKKGGDLAVLRATPDGFTEIGRFKLPKNSPTDRKNGAVWPHPVVANGKLYLRDFDYLFCFDLK